MSPATNFINEVKEFLLMGIFENRMLANNLYHFHFIPSRTGLLIIQNVQKWLNSVIPSFYKCTQRKEACVMCGACWGCWQHMIASALRERRQVYQEFKANLSYVMIIEHSGFHKK